MAVSLHSQGEVGPIGSDRTYGLRFRGYPVESSAARSFTGIPSSIHHLQPSGVRLQTLAHMLLGRAA
jgi:hypothetical protein